MVEDFSNFGDEISDFLEEVFSPISEVIDEDIISIEDDKREEVLSKVDVSDMTPEEYAVFMDYGIANAVKIFHSASGKVPERSVLLEVVSCALSHAVVTYSIDIAKEKKAAFRTHYGWKIREAATTYFRDLSKGRKNLLSNEGEEGIDRADSLLQAGHAGEANNEGVSSAERPEWESTERVESERLKKLEWCMRQVRHELPRESNLILDIEIGEVTDFEGKKIPLTQFAKLTGQTYPYVRKIKDGALLLIKQKMSRKGYVSLLIDDEKTVEDLHKETDIQTAIKAYEDSEDIIASTDAKTIVDSIDDELRSNEKLGSIFSSEEPR